MRPAWAIAFVLAAALLATSCKAEKPASGKAPGAGVSSSAPPFVDALPSRSELPTTDGAIAIGNLSSQISGLEKAIAGGAGRQRLANSLVSLLLVRGQYLGQIADYERALALSETIVSEQPERADAYLTRAAARSTLHLFEEALADIAEAEKRGTKPEATRKQRASILEAQGDLDAALVLRHEASTARSDLSTLGSEAALLAEMGRFDEAKKLFHDAVQNYPDVSPLLPAWLFFQQGRMYETMGDKPRAKACFAAAHDRLPAYAHAASHLAALEDGPRAIELLTAAASGSDDPEFEALLSERLREAGKTDEASKAFAEAGARYDELVAKHPAAFADHAGNYYLGANQPKRALALAKKNLETRKNEKAYELALLAAIAVGDEAKADACQFAREGSARPHVSDMFQGIAKGALASCDKP